jgi:hypothetical protein
MDIPAYMDIPLNDNIKTEEDRERYARCLEMYWRCIEVDRRREELKLIVNPGMTPKALRLLDLLTSDEPSASQRPEPR